MILGIDVPGLGSPHFNLSALLEAWPKGKGFALACFDGGPNSWPENFGDPSKNIRAVLDANPDVLNVIITLYWTETGIHILCPTGILVTRGKHFNDLALLYPHVRFFLVHSGEYQLAVPSSIQQRVDILKSVAPKCVPVNCPGNKVTLTGIRNKWDGIDAFAHPGDIVSTDGSDATQIDIKGWKKKNYNASIQLGWIAKCNLWGGSPQPPNLRTNAPTVADLKALVNSIQE